MKCSRLCYSFFVFGEAETSTLASSDDFRWGLIERKAQGVNAARVVAIFRENSLEPVLIKGVAAQRFYPKTHFRRSADVDLAVDPVDYDRALELFPALRDAGLGVDLHRGLRHLDTVEWKDLFSNSETIEIENTTVRILRPEDHLRVLCVHWLNDGGAYKERLWDIHYAIENRPRDFDWNRCLNIVSPTRRQWILTVIGLTHKYLDLDISGLPFASESAEVPEWVINTVENEWKSSVRIASIDMYVHDPVTFVQQLEKRLPPNPIQATIECEGSFAARTRVHYQFKSFFRRLGPSVKRIARSIFQRH